MYSSTLVTFHFVFVFGQTKLTYFKLHFTWMQKCLFFSRLWSDTIDVPTDNPSITLKSLNGTSSPCLAPIWWFSAAADVAAASER